MKKQRIQIEYPLTAHKPDVLWTLISTDHGLGRWLADSVTEDANGNISFTWGEEWGEHHTLTAQILERERHSHIRMQWTDDDDPDAYWEMRLGRSELTGELCLCVTDYAESDEVADLRELWDANLERLHSSSGF